MSRAIDNHSAAGRRGLCLRLAPVGVLCALVFAYWWYRIWTHAPLMPSPDLADMCRDYVPDLLFSRDAVLQGRFPLWNPFEFLGSPMFATLDYGPLYPSNWAYGLLSPRAAQAVNALLHFVLLGMFTFLYLRKSLKVGNGAALFGAAVVTFSSWSINRAMVWPDEHRSFVYVPLILLLLDRALERPSPSRWIGLAGVLTIQFFGGEPEVSARTGLLCVAYATMRLYQHWQRDRSWAALGKRLAGGTSTVALALGLGAVQLVPLSEAAAGSGRELGRLTFEQVFIPGAIHSGALFHQMISDISNYNVYYVGLVPLVAALFAFTRFRSETIFFAVCGAACFGAILGGNTFVARILYHLPTGSWFRCTARYASFLSFSVAVLAGIGLHTLNEELRGGTRSRLRRAVPVLIGTAATVVALVWERHEPCLESTAAVVVFLCSTLGMIAAYRFHGAKAVLHALFLFVMAGSLLVPWCIYPTTDFILPEGVDLVGLPGGIRGYLKDRLAPAERFYADYALEEGRRVPKVGALLGMPCINGHSPFIPTSFWDYVREYRCPRLQEGEQQAAVKQTEVGLWGGLSLESGAAKAFKMLGVRYLVIGLGNELFGVPAEDWMDRIQLPSTLRRVMEQNGIVVFENLETWPRAFVIQEIEAPSLAGLYDAAERGAIPAPILEYSPHRVVIEPPKGQEDLLILTDQYFPGWRAYVDGEPRPIVSVGGLFRGVRLNGTEDTVVFEYRPASFTYGAVISLCSLLVALLALCVQRHRNKKAARIATSA